MSWAEAEYRQCQAVGGVADLSNRAKFRLTGADRLRYLNGQVTANVLKLAPGVAMPACVTTAKGRLCGELWITATADALLLDAEADLREPLRARLERYIIADDVVLDDVTDEFRLFHELPGAGSSALGAAPVHRYGRPGVDRWLAADAEAPPGSPLLPPEYLELLRIEAGVPRWGRELTEETLPPEAGLERTHIDYHKGCYVGQETISRLKSIGHVNRHLRGFLAPAGATLHTGMKIASPGGPALGSLTSVAWSFALAKSIALGYLKRGSPENLQAIPATGGDPAVEVTVCELPFLTP